MGLLNFWTGEFGSEIWRPDAVLEDEERLNKHGHNVP